MSELKPCPFCGGEAEAMRSFGIGRIDHPFYIVECIRCWAKTAFCDTEAEAIEEWNTRAVRTCERLARGDSRDLYTYWVCSECNGSIPSPSNYCPTCGAKVVEP